MRPGKVIVALDVASSGAALRLVENLIDHTRLFKVGMELFFSEGAGVIDAIAGMGAKVFLDLKLHDIPNTVGRAAAGLVRPGLFMVNVHVAGGIPMMSRAHQSVKDASASSGIPRPLVIGVTVLTSLDASMWHDLGMPLEPGEQAVKWALVARKAGLDGVVASPGEAWAIRRACGGEFVIVTPGVRPTWADAGDQRRIMTPREAVDAGADYLVIGRPITDAASPRDALIRVLEELA